MNKWDEYVELREKMVALLDDAFIESDDNFGMPYSIQVADFLIANGVEIPTICKDCKYNDHEKAFRPEGIWCCYWGIDPDPNDFCSYGERREGE